MSCSSHNDGDQGRKGSPTVKKKKQMSKFTFGDLQPGDILFTADPQYYRHGLVVSVKHLVDDRIEIIYFDTTPYEVDSIGPTLTDQDYDSTAFYRTFSKQWCYTHLIRDGRVIYDNS
jgi:hypothetical protein